jgi:hypothetical protein
MGAESVDRSYRNGRGGAPHPEKTLSDEVVACFNDWVISRKADVATRVDEVAAQLAQASRNLAGHQPGLAALLRLGGARLGRFAENIEERSPNEQLRRVGRIAGDNPALFIGGIVSGIVAGAYLGRSRWVRR